MSSWLDVHVGCCAGAARPRRGARQLAVRGSDRPGLLVDDGGLLERRRRPLPLRPHPPQRQRARARTPRRSQPSGGTCSRRSTADSGLPAAQVEALLRSDPTPCDGLGLFGRRCGGWRGMTCARWRAAPTSAAALPHAPRTASGSIAKALSRVVGLAGRGDGADPAGPDAGATRRVFRFWHVAHRPFAIAALVAVLVHVGRGGRHGDDLVLVRRCVGREVVLVLALAGAAGRRGSRRRCRRGRWPASAQELEGTLKCTQCHGGRQGCDAGPVRRLPPGRRLAGRSGAGASTGARRCGATCASCHPDHAGVDFRLVKWPDGGRRAIRSRPDRLAAGAESCRTPECAECHMPANQVGRGRAGSVAGRAGVGGPDSRRPAPDATKTSTGAPWAPSARNCHDPGKWKVTPGIRPRHHRLSPHRPARRRWRAPSATRRAGVATVRDAGRPAGAGLQARAPRRPAPICHADVRKPDGSAPTAPPATRPRGSGRSSGTNFDHARTHFPLRWQACRRCAAPTATRTSTTEAARKPASGTCAACHGRPHAGTATIEGKPADCAGCHTVKGFAPSTFPSGEASPGPVIRSRASTPQVRCGGVSSRVTGPATRGAGAGQGGHAPRSPRLAGLPRR